jgi:hypothetical protein
MDQKQISPWLVAAVAAIVVILAVAAGWYIFQGSRELLENVGFSKTTISPNADGVDDAATISYEITRNAEVSIYFENDAGDRFDFRQDEARGVGEYAVNFSGVVQGYDMPGEEIEGEVVARLLQDGGYTWTILAVADDGETQTATGTLTIDDADTELPEIRGFEIERPVFSPNRDGIDDRVKIQFFLPKEVARSRVFLIGLEGQEMPVAEQELLTPANQPGRHVFDYEGGVDNNATPPPDGTYPVVAIVEDAEGQQIRAEGELTIEFGGIPRAEIISPPIGDTIRFSATAVALCDTITVEMTIENYGLAPIRTTGPAPGTVYDSDWNYNTLGWHTESGAWRAAIGYENEISNYPYRWAIGAIDELEKIGEHYYLMPGQRVVVTGSIRLVGPFGERNPQPVWAGLIHEDVEISAVNNRVDPHAILVDLPDVDNMTPCQPRDIPVNPEQ